MDYQITYLPQLQREKLLDLLNSPDFELLVSCIKAELAHAELEAARFHIWRDINNIADSRAKPFILRAQRAQQAIDLIEEMKKKDYKFPQITITP